ncbi:MAG: hypothetical protein R3F28_13625 [Candidatus Kapaibacterium sp.]
MTISVWTKLSEAGYGLKGYNGAMVKHPTVAMSRPQSAEITYVYTKTGQVDSMFYPAILLRWTIVTHPASGSTR